MKLLLTLAGVTAVIAMLIGGRSPNSFILATPRDNSIMVIKSGTGKGTVYSESAENLCDENCDGPVSIPMQEGSLMTLKAEAVPGSEFAGWAGPCKGRVRSCTVIAGSQTRVTAKFNLIRQ
ncbi:hypothetical protein L0222_32325 [bacterium]|nr:hypothetical protein [bacterium]